MVKPHKSAPHASVKPRKVAPHVALYCRLSPRPDGVYEGVEDQERWGRAYAAIHWPGVPIVVYADAGKSASKEDVQREGYERLLAAIRAGIVLHLWAVEQTRLTRREDVWFDLTASLERVRIAEVHTKRDGVLRVGDEASGIRAVISAGETRRLRGRVLDKMAENARAGRPHGRTPYGYQRTYDARSGKPLRQEIYEPEAVHIRELFDRLAAGHAFKAIARDWVERGIVSRSGRPFHPSTLRDMALRAAYAGYRVHDTERRRTSHGRWRDDAVTATWEPIVDPERYEEVRKIITDPKRLTARPGRARYLLTMIARCDLCSAVVGPRNQHNRWVYRCTNGGHVTTPMDDMDRYIGGLITAYLAREDLYTQWATASVDEELREIRSELRRLRHELEDAEAEAQAVETAAEARILGRLIDTKERRIDELEDRERELVLPPVLRELAGPDAAARWAAAPMSARREAARMLLVPERLGELRITTRPEGLWVRTVIPAEDRVAWRRPDNGA